MMAAYEIHINRRGINSIEIPRQVEVQAGEELLLRFVNHGHPTHVSISALNQQLFTDFIQENLYVADELLYPIPIREGPYTGVFDMEVVTGYGTKRGGFKIFVTKKQEAPEKPEKKTEPERPSLLSLITPSLSIWLAPAIGLVLLILWLLFRGSELGLLDGMVIIAFFLVLAGILLAWSHRRQS